MSGLFGMVRSDGPRWQASDWEPVQAALRHRGPDGSDVWRQDLVVLGHCLLCSTPESLDEALPYQDPSSGLVITADARIDNRDELAEALGIPREGRAALPDSHFILAAWTRWGAACLDRLLGDFAFAIWNPVDRSMCLARDPMGVRPLYYWVGRDRLVFASSAVAVTAAPDVPRKIDERRVADFLVGELEGIDNTCTFFGDVHRLPPAHHGVFEKGGFKIHRYWQPDPGFELNLSGDDEYVDGMEDVLAAAVAARMRSHGPPASMVSGGIDSSLIARIAARHGAEQDRTLLAFSGVSDDETGCRESRNIRLVLASNSFDSTILRPGDVPAQGRALATALERIEDPFGAYSILLLMIYLEARNRGCSMMLDGLDGDGIASLASNYPAYLIRSGHWIEAGREIDGLHRNYYQGESSLARDWLAAIKPSLAPRAWWRRRWNQGAEAKARSAVAARRVGGDLAERVDLAGRYREFTGHYHAFTGENLRQKHARRITAPFLTAAIERYERLASACGVEARHPLLDRRVVEYCLSLPRRLLVRNGWSKYVLRKVAERHLSADVAWRRGWDALGGNFMDSWHRWNRPAEDALLHRLARAVAPEATPGDDRPRVTARKENAEIEGSRRTMVYFGQWIEHHGLDAADAIRSPVRAIIDGKSESQGIVDE